MNDLAVAGKALFFATDHVDDLPPFDYRKSAQCEVCRIGERRVQWCTFGHRGSQLLTEMVADHLDFRCDTCGYTTLTRCAR